MDDAAANMRPNAMWDLCTGVARGAAPKSWDNVRMGRESATEKACRRSSACGPGSTVEGDEREKNTTMAAYATAPPQTQSPPKVQAAPTKAMLWVRTARITLLFARGWRAEMESSEME